MTKNFITGSTVLGSIRKEKRSLPIPCSISYYKEGQYCKPVLGEIHLSLVNSFNTSKLGNDVKIFRGCFTKSHKLLLSQNNERVLHLCDVDGSNIKSIPLDFDPHQVTCYDDNMAIVSGGYECFFGFIKLSTLKPGKKTAAGDRCNGVCCMNGQTWFTIVTDTITLIGSIGQTRQKVASMTNSKDMCVDKDGISLITKGILFLSQKIRRHACFTKDQTLSILWEKPQIMLVLYTLLGVILTMSLKYLQTGMFTK